MRFPLATLLLLALCGCGSSRSKFPGQKIPCNSNSDCPGGSHCASNACRDDSDKTAPTLTSSKLTLVPATTNTLRTVTALGAGTVGHYEFTASETLDRAPLLQSDQNVLACTAPLGDGTSFTSDCSLADALTLFTGDVAVTAQLFDLSLNQTLAQLPPAPVDTQPPDPPRVDLPGAVVHQRKPWGASLEDAGVTERVTFAAGSLEGGAFVRITLPVTKVQVGTGTAAADGSLVVDLTPIDSPQVLVRAIDGAGNSSVTVPVSDGRWAATMGQKVLGSTLENPHELALVPVFTASAEPFEATSVTLDGPATATGGYTWSPRRYASPESTEAFALLDTTRAAALLYVGDVSAFNQGGYYEWSGDEWVPLQTSAQNWPQLHNGPCVAYDEGRRRAVLFGGTNALGARTDATYVFENGAWAPYAPAHSPPARNHTTCFYSRALGGVVLFSGLKSTGIMNDEWLFGDDWVQLTGVDKPPAREQALALRDTLGDRVVMVGGLLADGGQGGDTWLFADGGWQGLSGQLPMPDGGSGCYDVPNARFLVKPFTDPQVYALTDAGWAPSEISSPMTFRALVSEPAGGTLLAVTNGGTFELIDTTRSQLAQTNPVEWNGVTTRLAYDPQLASVRAFVETDGGTLQDWVLARNGWSLAQSVPFAADLDDVGLDLAGAQWVLAASDGSSWVSPEGKTDAGWQKVVSGSPLSVIGMVNESGELWGTPGFDAGLLRWTGAGWSAVAGAGTFSLGTGSAQDYGVGLEDGGALWLTTAGNGSAGLEFAHGQFVAGKVNGLDDGAGVLFEPNAHVPVLFGGRTGAGASDTVGVLLLSGAAPSLSLPRVADAHGWGAPSPRMGSKLVFDAARQRTLMFGGNDTKATRFDDLSDFWELSGPGLTPAVVFHVALDAAKLPVGVAISSLTASFAATGAGGVNAWLHTPSGWQPLATGTPSLSFTVTDPALLDALTTNQSRLDVAVTPAQTNGALGATVTLSDIEVELFYRYP